MHLDVLEGCQADEARPIDEGYRCEDEDDDCTEEPCKEIYFMFGGNGVVRAQLFYLFLDKFVIYFIFVQADLFEEVIEGGHCQHNHNDEQVKDLEEAPEESPLAHEGMPLLDVLCVVQGAQATK